MHDTLSKVSVAYINILIHVPCSGPCPIFSVHVPVYLLQERVQRGVLRCLDFLHQLSMLGDQLPEVSQFLQQSGEEEAVVGVVGQQVEPQCLNDAFLQLLHQRHVHQAWPIWSEGIRQREREEGGLFIVHF